MDVSVKGEYALRAVFDLAGRGGPDPVKIAEIAARQRIPQKFLELILSQLKQGGFLGSRRGADGGYFPSAPAAEHHRGGHLTPHRWTDFAWAEAAARKLAAGLPFPRALARGGARTLERHRQDDFRRSCQSLEGKERPAGRQLANLARNPDRDTGRHSSGAFCRLRWDRYLKTIR